jgi:hypothetical protein
MQALATVLPEVKSSGLKTKAVMTNLYELIEALNEEMEDDRGDLIPQIVVRLFDSGRVKYIGNRKQVSPLAC